MANIGVLLLVVGLSLNFAEGRKCWHCENARGNEHCKMIGYLEECLLNQEYCQNDVRAIGNLYFEVNKKCKQDNSCTNNKNQNFTGSAPFQCATEYPHSVCRCCCGFDNCNGPEINCLQSPPPCPEPEAPLNGFKRCPSNLAVGAVCYYGCNPGYKRQGPQRTECAILGSEVEWTFPPPTCITEPCQPLESPEGGSITCTDGSNIGSECTLTCEDGRVLLGRRAVKCSIFSIWDGDIGECRVVDCFPPRPLDPNFVPPEGECTDGYNYLSTCRFACDPDYDLVGEDEMVCGPPVKSNNKGTWTPPRPPRCQKKTCAPQPPDCPETEVGETCTKVCERCERLVGNSEITCTRDGWTGTIGTCVTITCTLQPPPPINGFILCDSDEYRCDETCRYSCDSGYRLVGSAVTTCLESGTWTGPPPICEVTDCDPFELDGISKSCSAGDSLGSVCQLTCDDANTILEGSSEVECRRDPGDALPNWKPNLNQFCRPILCPNFPRPGEFPPARAGTLTCGAPNFRVVDAGLTRWRVGAECNIQCNPNYQVKDLISRTECTAQGNVGEWTVETLCCVECVPNPALDVVVFIDKTVDQQLWTTRIAFLEGFLDFIVFEYGFNLNITFIPYSDDVDYANDIDFFTIDDDQNPLELGFLETQLSGVPLTPGQDSNSVLAIREALDNIFGFHNFRAPMIFLVTSNAPSDIAGSADEVAELRRQAIHVRVFPIIEELLADAGANRAALERLVDEPEFVVDSTDDTEIDEENFYILASDRLITVTTRKCNEKAQGLQPCLFDGF